MRPFEPDGVYAGIPYRVLPDASIEAMMPGGLVKFKDVDQLLAVVNDGPAVTITTQSIIPRNALSNLHKSNAFVPALASPFAGVPTQHEHFDRDGRVDYSSMSTIDLMRHIHGIALAVARIDAESRNNQSNGQHLERIGSEATSAAEDPSSWSKQEKAAEGASTWSNQELQVLNDTARLSSGGDLQIISPKSTPPLYPGPHPLKRMDEAPHPKRPEEVVLYARGRNLLFGFFLVCVMLIAVAIVAGTLWPLSKTPSPTEVASSSQQPAESRPMLNGSGLTDDGPVDNSPKLAYPLPASYGIYVLSNDKLAELKALPISVPDRRVAISAELKQPSSTEISENKPAFILFRRDLLNNAPQTLSIRVVAHMARETRFVNGKAKVTKIEGAWRIRNKAYDLRVSPVPGQREMVIAHLAENTSLPAGRYALVLNRIGYDFTVQGPETSPVQCVELFETVNGLIFSECESKS